MVGTAQVVFLLIRKFVGGFSSARGEHRRAVRMRGVADEWTPSPEPSAARAIADALAALRYSEASIDELLGEDGRAAGTGDVAVYDRRLPDSPLATAIRLLLLQLTVPAPAAARALGRAGVDALVATGLARRDAKVLVPRGRIVPVEGLLLAFDGFPAGEDDPPGYVASFSPTASWCASLTPRRRVQRALDVGAGNGAQALLASRHSRRVVATDINPRALAYTELNAALNGIRNVETRRGSLFEPVAGERFDLITCNAPFVISPELKWHYRDGGFPADELSAEVVRGAAAALAEDGFATLLVSWLAASENAPDEHVFTWLEGCGCDAWVLGLSGADPLEHAAGWNEHLADDEAAFGAALDEWVAYFRDLGAGWITEGAVLLHRRAGRRNGLRADPVSEDDLQSAGAQIERAFAVRALLAGGASPLDLRPALAEAVRIEHLLEPRTGREETRIVLDEGTCPELVVGPALGAVVASLDGRLTPTAAIERTVRRRRLSGRAAASLRREARETLTELLELGFFEL
jgi:SAM-dependent methyltransferase